MGGPQPVIHTPGRESAETLTIGEGSQSLVRPPDTDHLFVLSTLAFLQTGKRGVRLCVCSRLDMANHRAAGVLSFPGIAGSARSAKTVGRLRSIHLLVSPLATDTA